MRLYFNFHHHTILVSGNETAVLEKIKEEFHYFFTQDSPFAQTTVDILKAPRPEIPSLVANKILEHVTVYDLGQRRFMDYGGSLVIWDKAEATVKIYSEDSDRLFEHAFLAIHSILGQELEKRGLCRVHAVGISLKSINSLVMLPSKGGKSTLLMELLKHQEVKIISDDMPLIDGHGRVHAFPSKLAIAQRPEAGPLAELKWTEFKRTQWPPKWTAGLSQLKDRIETESEHQKTFLIAGLRLSKGGPMLEKVSAIRMFIPLMEHMVVGIGLPQVLEMFLTFSTADFWKMFVHGLLRTKAALRLALRSECYHFYLGPDAAENSRALVELMHER